MYSVRNRQQLVVPGERFMLFFVKRDCSVALLQDHICSVSNLCMFAFARVTDS